MNADLNVESRMSGGDQGPGTRDQGLQAGGKVTACCRCRVAPQKERDILCVECRLVENRGMAKAILESVIQSPECLGTDLILCERLRQLTAAKWTLEDLETHDPIRSLAIAGALIAAEIDRLLWLKAKEVQA